MRKQKRSYSLEFKVKSVELSKQLVSLSDVT